MLKFKTENDSYKRYKCVVLSDLHLFSRGDSPEKTMNLSYEIVKQITKCNKVILNGDIFKIEMGKWDVKDNINAAIEYLENILSSDLSTFKYHNERAYSRYREVNDGRTNEELIAKFWKNRELVFIPGNHDCRLEFSLKLEQLQEKYPHFKYEADGYKLGGILITHGDRELRKSNKLYADLYAKGDPFYKRHFIEGVESSRGGKWIAMIYGLLENTLIKIHDDIFHKASHVSKFIVGAYKDMPERLNDVHTIITGHTHIPFFNHITKFFDKEIAIHNVGSPRVSSLEQYGQNFLPLRFTYETLHDATGNLIKEYAHVNSKYMQRFTDKMNELIKTSRQTILPDNFIKQLSASLPLLAHQKQAEKKPHSNEQSFFIR